ncbi:MAG: hypothetical protein J5798_01220 [Spirochaetaceae bacterium]|nr:hypothetical protein [Spirochaetaceae bacterium]MBO4727074.1 hypothetical protein [Spirochaetaceae bacterium]
MTLSLRNRIIRLLTIFSAVIFLTITALYVIQFFNGSFMDFPQMTRFFNQLPDIKPFQYTKWAVLAAPTFILCYITVCSLLIIKYFEKTHAPEIVYFTTFLINMLVEASRLFLPVLNLWQGNYFLLIVVSKFVFFCRLTGFSIMLCGAALSSTKNEMQDSSSRFGLTALAVLTACSIPVNSLTIYSTWVIPTAYYTLFLIIRFLFAITTSVSFLITAKKNEVHEYKQTAIFFLLLSTGLIILQETDNPAFFISGVILLTAGTFGFLRSLHNYYLWK